MKKLTKRGLAVLLSTLIFVTSLIGVLPTVFATGEKDSVSPFFPFNATALGEIESSVTTNSDLFTDRYNSVAVLSSDTVKYGNIAETNATTGVIGGKLSGFSEKLGENGAILLYVKIGDAANRISIKLSLKDRFISEMPALILASGKEVELLAKGESVWSLKETVATGGDAAIPLDAGFEGYIKLPISVFNAVSEEIAVLPEIASLKSIELGVGAVGGEYGEVEFTGFVLNENTGAISFEINPDYVEPTQVVPDPIEATPIIPELYNMMDNANKSTVKPFDWAYIDGYKMEVKTTYDFSAASVKQDASTLHFEVDSYALGSSSHLMFYVETDGPTAMTPYFIHINGGNWDEYYVKNGATIQILADGAASWTESTAVAVGTSHYGVRFTEEFKGFVKIPLSDMLFNGSTAATGKGINHLYMMTEAMGGENAQNITVGPFLAVTADSSSTNINVPEEYKPTIIEATPFNNYTINGSGGGWATRSKVQPISTINVDGYKFVLKDESAYDISANSNTIDDWSYLQHMYTAAGTTLGADTTHLLMYFETNGPIDITFRFQWTNRFSAATTYQYAKIGDTEWTSAQAKLVTANEYGMSFSSEFKGYIKIDYSCFNFSGTSSIENLYIVPAAMGQVGDGKAYATSFTIGAFMGVTKDSNLTEIKVPEEWQTISTDKPLMVKPISDYEKNVGATLSGVATVTETEPLDWSNLKGISLEATGSFDVSTTSSLDRDSNVQILMHNSASGRQFDSNTKAILVYLKTDGPIALRPYIYDDSKTWTTYGLANDAKYTYMQVGDNAWTEANAVTVGNASCQGIKFAEAFEGYVKIPLTSYGMTAAGNHFDYMYMAFEGLGGDKYADNVTVGPYFTVIRDSVLTEIEEEPISAKPLENGTSVNYETATITQAAILDPTGLTALNGGEINVNSEYGTKYEYTGTKLFESKAYVGYSYSSGTSLADGNGFMFYLKTESAGRILAEALMPISAWSYGWNPSLMLKPGSKYYFKTMEATKWSEGVAVLGQDGFDGANGAMSFDGAFEGFVKIPFSSLTNDSGYVLNKESHAPEYFRVRAEHIGEGYGTVTAGPILVTTNNSTSANIKVGTNVLEPTEPTHQIPDDRESPVYERIQNVLSYSESGERQGYYFMVGDDARFNIGYPTFRLVGDRLAENYNVECKNFSKSGLTAEGWSTAEVDELISEIPNDGKGVIIDISLGALDTDKTAEEIAGFINTGIAKIKTAAPYAVIVFTSSNLTVSDQADTLQGAVASKVWEDTSVYKIDVLTDVFTEFYTQFFNTKTLPSVDGYRQIAKYILSKYEGTAFTKVTAEDSNIVTLPEGANLVSSDMEETDSWQTGVSDNLMKINGNIVVGKTIVGEAVITGNMPHASQNNTGFKLPVNLTNADYIAFRISVPAANVIAPVFHTGDSAELVLMVDKDYEVMADGDISWTTRKTVKGSAYTDTEYGAFSFDSAFTGWVRIPYIAFKNELNTESQLNGFNFLFSEIGGKYGKVNIGPFIAMQKPVKVNDISVPIGATPVENGSEVSETGGVKYETEIMKNNDKQYDGYKIIGNTAISGNYPHSSGNAVHIKLNGYTDTSYITFRMSVPAANTISIVLKGENDNDIFPLVTKEYEVMADGTGAWVKKNIVQASEFTTEEYGGISFEDAFTGWIRIPLTSLKGDFDNTSSWTKISFAFSEIGGDYGTVLIGPFAKMIKETVAPEITVPTEATVIKEGYSLGERWNIGTSKGYWTIGNERVYGFNLSGNKIISGQLPLVSENGVMIKLSEDYTNSSYVLFHISVPGKNTIALETNKTDIEGSERRMLVGKEYEVMADGDTSWTKKKTVQTSPYTEEDYGGIFFDNAFSGWVRLPLTSFNGSYEDSDKWNNFRFAFSELGGNYGDINIGPFATQIKPIVAPEITAPAGATIIKDGYSIGESWNIGNYKSYWTIGTEKVYGFNFSGNKAISGQLPLVSENGVMIKLSEDYTNSSYVLFHISVPGKNTIALETNKTDIEGSERRMLVGKEYEVMADGDTSWTKKKTVQTSPYTEEDYGGIFFDNAFSGWVRIPLTSFNGSYEDSDKWNNFRFAFSELGGNYGDINIGPFATQIKPIVAPEIKLPEDAVLISGGYSIGESWNIGNYKSYWTIGGELVQGFGFSGNKAISGQLPLVSENGVMIKLSEDYTNSSYVAFHISVPGKNTIALESNKTGEDGTQRFMMVGKEYEVMADGAASWTKKKTVPTSPYTEEEYGGLSFDSAFSGWVRIPITSFKGNYENDTKWNNFRFAFSEIGGDYGEINVGPFISMIKPIIAPEITLPKDAVLIKDGYNITESWNIGNYKSYWTIGGELVRGFGLSGNKEISGKLPYASENCVVVKFDEDYTNSSYILFHISVPGKNTVALEVKDAENLDKDAKFTLVGQKYEVMADGETEWSKKKLVPTSIYTEEEYGGISFDSAFSGWVRIPYSSFRGTYTDDSKWNNFRFAFSEIGGEYGEINIGPFAKLIEPPYTVENVWDKADLPEMVPFTAPVDQFWYWEMANQIIPSPIPSLSQNPSMYHMPLTTVDVDGQGTYNTNYHSTQKYDYMPIGDFSHMMFYVEVPKAKDNYMSLYLFTDEPFEGDSKDYRVIANGLYSLLPLGENKWQHRYAEDILTYNSGVITLPAGFKGFVKVPFASLVPSTLSNDTKIRYIYYRFGYAGMEDDKVLVGPVFGVTNDNDPGPEKVVLTSLPAATTIRRVFQVEKGDIFFDKVMLYWQSIADAQYYEVDTYTVTKAEEGYEYELVSTTTHHTNSGAVTGLTMNQNYAFVVKAYNKDRQLIAVYEYVRVKTLNENTYAMRDIGEGIVADGVIYPAGSSGDGVIGGSINWMLVAIIGGSVVLLGGIATVIILTLKKRRKTNE